MTDLTPASIGTPEPRKNNLSGRNGNGIDLNSGAARESSDAYGSAGREGLGEVAPIDLVDGGKVVQIDEIDRRARDVLVSDPGGGEEHDAPGEAGQQRRQRLELELVLPPARADRAAAG